MQFFEILLFSFAKKDKKNHPQVVTPFVPCTNAIARGAAHDTTIKERVVSADTRKVSAFQVACSSVAHIFTTGSALAAAIP